MGLYTTETELQHVFAKYGPLEKVQVVKDAKVKTLHTFLFFLSFELNILTFSNRLVAPEDSLSSTLRA